MNRGPLLSLLLLLSISALLWSSPASARGDRARARAYHKAGKKAYAAGDFEEAARAFSAGYTLDPRPGFLLNIAQSYRKADKPRKAIHYYEEYLRLAPNSKLRPQVEELIKEIEAEVKAQPAPAPEPLPAVDLTEEPPPPPRSEPIYKKWWFWTGVATVVVAASVGIGVYAGTREPDYVKEGGLGSVHW